MRHVAYYYITKAGCPCRVTGALHKLGVLIPANLRLDGSGFAWGSVALVQVIPGRRSRKQAYRFCETLIERTTEFRSRNKNVVVVEDYDLLYLALAAGSFKICAATVNLPKNHHA
jgi:hypothetical protein